MSLVLCLISHIFIHVRWISLMFMDFRWFSLILINLHWFSSLSIDFCWFYVVTRACFLKNEPSCKRKLQICSRRLVGTLCLSLLLPTPCLVLTPPPLLRHGLHSVPELRQVGAQSLYLRCRRRRSVSYFAALFFWTCRHLGTLVAQSVGKSKKHKIWTTRCPKVSASPKNTKGTKVSATLPLCLFSDLPTLWDTCGPKCRQVQKTKFEQPGVPKCPQV